MECHVDTKARYDSVHINQESGDGKNTLARTQTHAHRR